MYEHKDGRWVVYVEPEVARAVPPQAIAARPKLALPGVFAGQQQGTRVVAAAVQTIIPVPATDLMLRADAGRVTHTPPAWYADLIQCVAGDIAAELLARKAQLTQQTHGFVGPGRHVYDDGAVIAMASGLRSMFSALGVTIGGGVKVPEINRTVFLLGRDGFACVKSLGDNLNPPFADLATAAGAAANAQRTAAIANFRAVNPQSVGRGDDDVMGEIRNVHGTNPAYTKGGVALMNLDALTQLSDHPSHDVQAFIHLMVHEFVHANSDGGGGEAIAHHGLNQQHEEGVTDLIARAISDAINAARGSAGLDATTRAVVERTVPQVAAMTFGSNGGVRYQAEVDLVVRRIGDPEMLRNVVARAYFGNDAASKSAIAGALT